MSTWGKTYFLSSDGSKRLKSSLWTSWSFQSYSLKIRGVSLPTTIGNEWTSLYFEFWSNFSITGVILISNGKGLYEEIMISWIYPVTWSLWILFKSSWFSSIICSNLGRNELIKKSSVKNSAWFLTKLFLFNLRYLLKTLFCFKILSLLSSASNSSGLRN